MTKLDAGLITSLPASDPGSAAVWGSKRINPRPQFCLCLTWSGCPSNDDDDDEELPSDLSGTEVDSSETSSTDDDLDILIKTREKAAEQNRQSFTSVIFTSNNAMQRNSIMVLLNSFANKPRLGKNENVLQHWEQFKESKRELYELSQVILAVFATPVSVGRAFSSLKYILSPL